MNLVLFDQWFHGPTRAHLVDAATVDGTISWNETKITVMCGHLGPRVIDSTHPDWQLPTARDLRKPPCATCMDKLKAIEHRAKVVGMIAHGHAE